MGNIASRLQGQSSIADERGFPEKERREFNAPEGAHRPVRSGGCRRESSMFSRRDGTGLRGTLFGLGTVLVLEMNGAFGSEVERGEIRIALIQGHQDGDLAAGRSPVLDWARAAEHVLVGPSLPVIGEKPE